MPAQTRSKGVKPEPKPRAPKSPKKIIAKKPVVKKTKAPLATAEKEVRYEKSISLLSQYFDTYKVSSGKYRLNSSAVMTLISASLHMTNPEFNFVGFYTVDQESNVLVIGPYQSDILASPFIESGKGVCGSCWLEGETQIVNDVKACKNYIACDDVTKAEICVPVRDPNTNEVVAVFDIDSLDINRFDSTDQEFLEKILAKFYS
jgi:L-methionine (R)-S-oxide reductase